MQGKIDDVRQAISREEVHPCFQPIIDLRTGALTSFEVLARWRHPELGLILPDNFISLAEEHGLLGELTKQVLRKAFRASPALPKSVSLAVNFSPLQLLDLDLPQQILDAAEGTGFPLDCLMIEITESALIQNLTPAQQVTHRLKGLGCGLALDDFGTGYSSLSQLQRFGFDQLKIAGSFVRAMTTTRENRKIVAAMIGLGHSLDLVTVAEEIETQEQAEMLLWLGCELGQGWLFGRPFPPERLAEQVASSPLVWWSNNIQAKGNQNVISGLEALPAQRLAQLQAIYDGAPVGLCFLDRNFRYVSINRRLAEMNGLAIEAHLGRTVKEIIPASYPNLEPYLSRALLGDAISNVSVQRMSARPEQEPMTVLLSYYPAYDEGGEIVGISAAVMDITEISATKAALTESEDHFRSMVELNPQVPWIMSPEGNILDVSTKWEETTGLTRERSLNLGWLAALHPDDVEPTMKAVGRALRSGESIDIRYRIKDKNDGWRWMRSRGSPRHAEDGTILRWYGSVEDIDELKQIEEALRSSHALLRALLQQH